MKNNKINTTGFTRVNWKGKYRIFINGQNNYRSRTFEVIVYFFFFLPRPYRSGFQNISPQTLPPPKGGRPRLPGISGGPYPYHGHMYTRCVRGRAGLVFAYFCIDIICVGKLGFRRAGFCRRRRLQPTHLPTHPGPSRPR